MFKTMVLVTHFLRKHILLTITIVSAVVILTSMNKYWAPYDEGIVTVAAERVLNGEVPYRDFFIIMYPPGQVYVLALLYKIFGIGVAIGRFYTVFVQIIIALSVFMFTRTLTGKTNISLCAWLFTLTCLGPRMGTIPAPIWPGMAFAVLALYTFAKYVKSDHFRYIAYAGILTGITSVFRHEIGIAVFISILIGWFLFNRKAGALFVFVVSSFILPAAFLSYFAYKTALPDLFDSLIMFPFIHEKTGGLTFPNPCFNLNMIFHKSLFFIKVNQYYIPLLIYGFVLLYLLVGFFRKRKLNKEMVIVSTLLIFGLLIFNQVRVRTDPAHLLTGIYPAVILFAFMFNKSLLQDTHSVLKYSYLTYVYIICFLFFLLAVKNGDKYFKNVFKKPYTGKVVLTEFARGTLYIPRDERDDVVDVVSFIKSNTGSWDKIFIGNSAHWVDTFGGEMLLYTLSERLPSTKYYEIAPGILTQTKVQKEITQSLSEKIVRLIVLKDINLSDNIQRPQDADRQILDNYINKHYKHSKKFGMYNIYETNNIY